MTMIEKLARAVARIHVARSVNADWTTQGMGHAAKDALIARLVDQHWKKHEAEARAVLQALREPSEGMVEAGMADGDCPHARETFVAMIDHALGEG